MPTFLNQIYSKQTRWSCLPRPDLLPSLSFQLIKLSLHLSYCCGSYMRHSVFAMLPDLINRRLMVKRICIVNLDREDVQWNAQGFSPPQVAYSDLSHKG